MYNCDTLPAYLYFASAVGKYLISLLLSLHSILALCPIYLGIRKIASMYQFTHSCLRASHVCNSYDSSATDMSMHSV